MDVAKDRQSSDSKLEFLHDRTHTHTHTHTRTHARTRARVRTGQLIVSVSPLFFVVSLDVIMIYCFFLDDSIIDKLEIHHAKCHSMRVTRHFPSNQIHFNYSLHQQTLCYVPGVTRRLRKPTSWLASNKLCLKFNKSI